MAAHAVTRCSQLSSTSSAWRFAKCARRVVMQRLPRLLAHADRGGDREHDALGIGHGREVDEPHAVGRLGEQDLGDLEREARLAAAADAGEREQARRRHRVDARVDLVLPADEARGLRGRLFGATSGASPAMSAEARRMPSASSISSRADLRSGRRPSRSLASVRTSSARMRDGVRSGRSA